MTDEQHIELIKGLTELKTLYTGVVTQMTIANGRTSKLEGKNELLEKLIEKQENRIMFLEKGDATEEKANEKRKDWMWGALEKVGFMVLSFLLSAGGAVILLVLTKLGILKLS